MKKKDRPPVEPLIVDIQTAAELLNVSERTIRNLTRRGELPVVRIASRVLYSRTDLIEFIRQRSKREPNDADDNPDSAASPQTP